MFPWYVDLALVLFILACFRGIWLCSTRSGFPTHRIHPSELEKVKIGSGD
jgi:hypothetical protein